MDSGVSVLRGYCPAGFASCEFSHMLSKTYFALSDNFNPFYLLDQWLNPARYTTNVSMGDGVLEVFLTNRARKALEKRSRPLVVEMQLYFSCVVKKRVIFHDDFQHKSTPVNDLLAVAFRTVEPTSCDPVEFANNYPEKQELNSAAARRMRAKRLVIDYKRSTWQGEFSI